jgi:hypothetical protein
MSTPASKAYDRSLKEWFEKIERSELKLPRFQRHEAWDRKRIASLLDTIVHNLPLGITLLLEVNKESEPFVSRFLVTSPEIENKVTEHLLDGQQRLTSFWRALHNNYEWETYFVYCSEFDCNRESNNNAVEVRMQPRWTKKNTKRPLWADSPKEALNRGLLPMNLFKPGDNSSDYEGWINEAILHLKPAKDDPDGFEKLEEWNNYKDRLVKFVRNIKSIITHYNLPYLSLPLSTSKDIALQVFINMNTNSKPLSQYDIIRAEIEGVKGVSLDEYEKSLNAKCPKVKFYFELPFLILATSALIQDKLPNQRGMWDMKKDEMVENWAKMENGLKQMADFLESQGIYDKDRLPTNAVLAVIATLYTLIPETLDERGKAEILLKKYLWSAFFTDRYENSAASHAYNDFVGLKRIITKAKKDDGSYYSENEVPIFNKEKYPVSALDELLRVGWPKRENIRARGIMAVFSKLGAIDFADGVALTRDQLVEGKRHYHHVFPASILEKIETEAYLALNCALITDKTNLNISNKEPFRYLQERFEWTDEDDVNTRLKSHLIPISELKNGGYDGLEGEEKIAKITEDYNAFIQKRGAYVVEAINRLVGGKDINSGEIINFVEQP